MSLASTLQYCVSFVFLLFVLSYYAVFCFPRRKGLQSAAKQRITILVPAHNESSRIAACLEALEAAAWTSEKRIVVIDDGSTDSTIKVVKRFKNVLLLRQKHTGKAAAINYGLSRAKTPFVAIVDADSYVKRDALVECAKRFMNKGVGAVCASIRVHNRHSLIGLWLHLEQLYGSFIRSQLSKINANIVAAGPLTMFRSSALKGIGGFSMHGYSEDVDIAIRLQRAGWVVEFADKAAVETVMPTKPKSFVKQRRRFARGWVNIFRKHVKLDVSAVGLYALPLALFTYFQAIIMAPILLFTIGSGYYTYFASQGVYMSWTVAKYFIEWLSAVGVIHWAVRLFSGAENWTAAAVVGLAAAALSYPLYLVAAVKYEGKLKFSHIMGVLFLFPFWLFIMTVYLLNIGAWFDDKQRNRWEK